MNMKSQTFIFRIEPLWTIVLVFVLAFAANIAWEFAHSVLYVHYQVGEITNLILLRAAFFDAIFITLLAIPILFVPYLRARLWIALIIGVLFAIGLEWFALSTGRWAYGAAMPIIPIIKTGLSPTVQLGLISWGVYTFVRRSLFKDRQATSTDAKLKT